MILGYTRPEDVINEAGLSLDNIDVQRAVRTHIMSAEAIVNGAIGNIYNLPLGFRMRNSIEFSGAGTGTATLTVTINGTDYTVAVVDEMTAAEAADLLRDAFEDSTTFVADQITDADSDHTVIFSSVSLVKATGTTQVTVTNTPGAAAGITATVATRLEYQYPGMIEMLTRLVAAALMLRESFGKNSQGSDNDGEAKFDKAMELIGMINNGTLKVMDDLAGVEISKDSNVLPQFNPTKANTDLDSGETGHTPRNFKYDEQF